MGATVGWLMHFRVVSLDKKRDSTFYVFTWPRPRLTSSGGILLGVTLQWTPTTDKYHLTEQAQAPLFPYSKLEKEI